MFSKTRSACTPHLRGRFANIPISGCGFTDAGRRARRASLRSIRLQGMSPQLADEIVEALKQSQEEFLAAASAAGSLAGRKPAADRWSVIECMEHVTRVETLLLDRLQRSDAAPALDSGKEAALAARLADRTERRDAPEAVRPTGWF